MFSPLVQAVGGSALRETPTQVRSVSLTTGRKTEPTITQAEPSDQSPGLRPSHVLVVCQCRKTQQRVSHLRSQECEDREAAVHAEVAPITAVNQGPANTNVLDRPSD